MLTKQENDRLTQVGTGTPMGNLMRRYWHPVAGTAQLALEPTKAVRLLGEDLVVYKGRDGHYGVLGLRCPHRKASLEYGIPETNGLRCCYHGWLFDREGNCLEQPAEPEYSRFKDTVTTTAYPVQEMGGLLWAYLGPQPAPLLPRFDIFVDEDGIRDIGVIEIPCNWLQCMENSVDLTHVDHLHGYYFDYVLEKLGRAPLPSSQRVFNGRRHSKISFDLYEYGIIKRRLIENASEDSASWKVGTSPIIFPTMTTAVGAQIRVPVDDTHTRMFLYSYYTPNDDGPVQQQAHVPVYPVPYLEEDGTTFITDGVTFQDFMVMTTQGPILDRSDEKLGASDEGIVFFRNVLSNQIERIEQGEDPLGTVRDPKINDRIALPHAGGKPGKHSNAHFMDTHWQRYSPIYQEARALVLRGTEQHKQPQGV